MPLRVLRSRAGWYIGRICECGPYSRESLYFSLEAAAKKALERGDFPRNQLGS
jgi:hypothetical protein